MKAEAKVGILDETFMNLRNVEVALFAADAAASCSSARLLSGDDPHGCSAAVKYAMKQVAAVRNAMHLEKRKYKINRGRNKKSKMKMQEHSKWLNTKIQNVNESRRMEVDIDIYSNLFYCHCLVFLLFKIPKQIFF